jgi:hypothetical protein
MSIRARRHRMSIRARRRMSSCQILTTGTLGNGGAGRTGPPRTSDAQATGFMRTATAGSSPKVRHMGIWQDRGAPRAVASPKVRDMGNWQERGVPRAVASPRQRHMGTWPDRGVASVNAAAA